MLVVFSLLKTKQINDLVLNKVQQKPFLTVLPQRLLIIAGTFLDYFIGRIRPDDRTLAELKKTKQQSRLNQQTFNRPNVKPNQPVTIRQTVVSKQATVINRTNDPNFVSQQQTQTGNARLTNVDNDEYTTETVDLITNGDIAELRAKINPTDIELLYSRLPADVLPDDDNQEPLNEDQQQLHAGIIGAELERQGYSVNHDEDGE